MGWAVAGGVLGLILMFGTYRWLTGWVTVRSGAVSIPTIGTRPRRLAGVPEEAPADARMPPGMVVLRHGGEPIVIDSPVAAKPPAEAVTAAPVDAPEPEPPPVEAEVAPDPEPAAAVEPVAGALSGVEVTELSQGSEVQGEFVTISNGGPNPVSLEGWKLTDEGERHVYEFPAVILASSATVHVHMWRGEDTETDLYVGRRSRWWNNEGDTAYLYDASGTLVHSLRSGGEDSDA